MKNNYNVINFKSSAITVSKNSLLFKLLILLGVFFTGFITNAQIAQSGVTTQCNPSAVQLCSTASGSIYALNAYPFGANNSIAKYTTNFTNHSLVRNYSYTGPTGFVVNYGMDRNPVTGQVFLITSQGSGSERKLYTLNLVNNTLVNKGPVLSTSGNNQVQDFTFDNSGNMYAVFNDGTIQKINYNTALLTPTAFASGLPTNGGVGLTYDFDANRLIYATGTNASKSLWQISTTGSVSFMFNLNSNLAITAQAIEYVGNNICYCSSTDSSDLIYRIDLITHQVTSVLAPSSFVAEIKDLMYTPLSLQWSGSTGSLGNATCINVTPVVNSTYTLVSTNEIGVNTTSTATVTLAPCSTIVNLKLFIEGYYESAGTMRSVKNNQDGISPLTDVENITVELHNPTFPYAIVTSTIATLKTNGTAICNFPISLNGSFYIAVKNSNAVYTWSGSPQTVGATLLTYDFSSGINKAYGNNMKNLGGGFFAFYSGDINQDEVVDNTDVPQILTDITNSAFGIQVTDLNGDGSVDNSDVPFLENNATNSIFSIYPTQ